MLLRSADLTRGAARSGDRLVIVRLGRWTTIAFRRQPGGTDALVGESPASAARAAPSRVARAVKMPNGSLLCTDDAAPEIPQGRPGSGDQAMSVLHLPVLVGPWARAADQ